MQVILITTDCDEEEILTVLHALKNGDAHVSDGDGGVDQVPNVTFTCTVLADGQGYLQEPETAYAPNGEMVGYVDILGRS
jgi:hypothetical protein